MQGTEAGGHQASFLTNEINITSTLDLIKMVRSTNSNAPLIAAGGVSSSNYKKYFDIGADYVQLGTAFMMTHNSSLLEVYKNFIGSCEDTKLTKDITGKWARGVKNKLFEEISGKCHFEFPNQHYLTSPLRQESKRQQNPEYISLWAGSNRETYNRCTLEALIKVLKSIATFPLR